MCAYNAEKYLRESVSSVLNQTFKDFELVIVNDGSTDQSAQYLDSITDPRVRVIHQENKGLGQPQNETMRLCRGTYLMRMDADDRCHPTRIEKQVAMFEQQSDLVMVGCFFRFFGANGNVSPVSKQPTSHKAILSGMLAGWHTLAHATIMFERSLLDLIEGYVLHGAGEDWTLLLDAARHGEYGMVPEPLYDVRLHPSSNAWLNAEKVAKGFLFARRRHNRYLKTQTNLSPEEFNADWNKAGYFQKLRIRLEAYSNVLYRRSILGRLEGKFAVPCLQLALAILVNPSKATGAIWKRFDSNVKKTVPFKSSTKTV